MFCAFAETAVYVAESLRSAGHDALAPRQEFFLSVPSEPSSGEVLVCSDDVLLDTIDLHAVVLAINYDVPSPPRVAHLRWSRLDWSDPGRSPVMVTLIDPVNMSAYESRALNGMEYLIGRED